MVYLLKMKIKDLRNGLIWRMMAWVAQVSGGRPMLAAGSLAGTMRLPPGIILFIIVLKGKNSYSPRKGGDIGL